MLAADHRPWVLAVSRDDSHPNGSVLLVYLPEPDMLYTSAFRRCVLEGPAWSFIAASRPVTLCRDDGATWPANAAVAVSVDDEPTALATHPAYGWMLPADNDAEWLADVGLILTSYLHASAV